MEARGRRRVGAEGESARYSLTAWQRKAPLVVALLESNHIVMDGGRCAVGENLTRLA